MCLNVKKIAAAVLCVMMTAGVAFADMAISIDGRANLWSDTGFTITGGDDYLGQVLFSYDTEKAGGFMRFRLGEKSKPLALDRWNVWFKPFDFLKVSLQTAPYEIFAESIRWEPVYGAGLFETGSPKLIVELMPIDALTIMVGVDAGLQDAKKPWNTLAASVKYDIANIGSVAAEFSQLPGQTASTVVFLDGDIKNIGAQFQFTGVENLSVLLGYTAILVGGDSFTAYNDAHTEKELGAFAQSRIELFATYSMDKFAVALYEAALVRSGNWGTFGNRIGLKASYQINDPFSIWLKFDYFMNYAGTGYGWGGPLLADNVNGAGEKINAMRVEPRVEWNLGNGVTPYLGFNMVYNLTDNVSTYQIPLGIMVNF